MSRFNRKTIAEILKFLGAAAIIGAGLIMFSIVLPAIMIFLSVYTIINGILNNQ